MKEDIIQFKSYLVYNLVMKGELVFNGEFYCHLDDFPIKIQIQASKTNEEPIDSIPWAQTLILSSRFINKPFTISHPSLRNHTFVIKGFKVLSTHQKRVPLLYKMLSMAGLNY